MPWKSRRREAGWLAALVGNQQELQDRPALSELFRAENVWLVPLDQIWALHMVSWPGYHLSTCLSPVDRPWQKSEVACKFLDVEEGQKECICPGDWEVGGVPPKREEKPLMSVG